MLIELLLGEAEGKRLGGAGRAARLRISQPAVTAALLGTVWKVERHTALGIHRGYLAKLTGLLMRTNGGW